MARALSRMGTYFFWNDYHLIDTFSGFSWAFAVVFNGLIAFWDGKNFLLFFVPRLAALGVHRTEIFNQPNHVDIWVTTTWAAVEWRTVSQNPLGLRSFHGDSYQGSKVDQMSKQMSKGRPSLCFWTLSKIFGEDRYFLESCRGLTQS